MRPFFYSLTPFVALTLSLFFILSHITCNQPTNHIRILYRLCTMVIINFNCDQNVCSPFFSFNSVFFFYSTCFMQFYANLLCSSINLIARTHSFFFLYTLLLIWNSLINFIHVFILVSF